MQINRQLFPLASIAISAGLFCAGLPSALAEPINPARQLTAQASVSSNPKKVTEAEISRVGKEIRQAIANEDIDGAIKHLAPFIYSEVQVRTEVGAETNYVSGIEAHRDLIAKAFDKVNETETLSEQNVIRVSDDGNVGMVTTIKLETTTTEDGQAMMIASVEETRFGYVGDQLMVIAHEGRMRVDPRPAE
jgi:ketosteroid isomerase-like protein